MLIAKLFVSYVIGRNHKVQCSINWSTRQPVNLSTTHIIKFKTQCSKFKGNCLKDKKKEHSFECSFCDSDRIQTCNLLIRSQVLYSVELRNHYYGRTDNDLVIISELRVQRYCFLSVPPNV